MKFPKPRLEWLVPFLWIATFYTVTAAVDMIAETRSLYEEQPIPTKLGTSIESIHRGDNFNQISASELSHDN